MTTPDDAFDVGARFSTLVDSAALQLPLPGKGATRERFRGLAEIAARDLSLARLAEGHADAAAIRAEAGRPSRAGRHGVWAAEPPDARVRATRTRDGWLLTGMKRYASGAPLLDRALVTAEAEDGGRLFDVDVRGRGVRPIAGTWSAVGMAATESLDVVFDEVLVGTDDEVGGPGFYLRRPGFWQGAVGVAACWFGGALGAVRLLETRLREGTANEHQLAHLGAITAWSACVQTLLDDAARSIDDDPLDHAGAGERRALVVRHVVEQHCQEVLTRVGRAAGTGPLVFDRAHARRAADLVVYLRQHHAERDLVALGRLASAPVRQESSS